MRVYDQRNPVAVFVVLRQGQVTADLQAVACSKLDRLHRRHGVRVYPLHAGDEELDLSRASIQEVVGARITVVVDQQDVEILVSRCAHDVDDLARERIMQAHL